MMSPSAKSCHTTGLAKVLGALVGGAEVGGTEVGGADVGGVVGGAEVGGVVGGAEVGGLVAPVQATPLSVNPAGAGLLEVQLPLRPKLAVPPVAMAPL